MTRPPCGERTDLGCQAAKHDRNWQDGQVLNAESSKVFLGTSTSGNGSTYGNYGNYSGFSSARYGTEEIEVVDAGDKVYVVSRLIKYGWTKKANLTSNAPIKFALDGKNVNLLVEPGECIAITGRSGSGKSTLVKMISGLLQPQHGEVLLGNLPVQRTHNAGIGGRLAFVMQEDTLFSGSICENIHFFDDTPDLERVRECASLARIHDDIVAMPMGYETLVGDMGAAVSGGQKQRLLLARALYSRPSILVLDEATSHLDLETEKQIAQTLRTLQLTRIMVAHRPQTIAIADRVLQIEGGRLVSMRVASAQLDYEFAS
jgi:ABC-type transport system involved in cytochrome bd biosynthesis fused ATPase/permease subunit